MKNEIITLNSLDEIIKFYTNIRHVIYPNNCKPYEFRYTRQNKVSFTKLSNSDSATIESIVSLSIENNFVKVSRWTLVISSLLLHEKIRKVVINNILSLLIF